MSELVYETQRVQVWCGDNRDVLPRISGVALTVTSPPYNGMMTRQTIGDTITDPGAPSTRAWRDRTAKLAYDDELPEDEYRAQLAHVASLVYAASLPGASFFWNHKVRYRGGVWSHPLDLVRTFDGWQLAQEIVWARSGGFSGPPNAFLVTEERIYWLVRSDAKRTFNNTRARGWGTVWPMAHESYLGHPCPFPSQLPTRCILACSKRGDLVLDPYGGSGTTALAALRLGRRAVVIERDEQFADQIVQRIKIEVGS